MDKLDEVLQLLKTAMPLLEKFNQWQELEAEREKVAAEVKAESQREFEKWVEERRKSEASQQEDSEELQKHFFGGEAWKQERFSSHNY